MQGEFKQCSNGHYYQGSSCPYCKTGNNRGNATSLKTEGLFDEIENQSKTEAGFMYTSDGSSSGGARTTVMDDNETVANGMHKPSVGYNRTVFGDDDHSSYGSDNQPLQRRESSFGRKLVGWLVSYSVDELGVDYKLYEGRNIIGRDVDCNITVSDGRMSGKHAVLLFRANKYSLTDSQSSHGTYVNDEDIELEPRYLKDGDIIRMGNTIFKFRTSL